MKSTLEEWQQAQDEFKFLGGVYHLAKLFLIRELVEECWQMP